MRKYLLVGVPGSGKSTHGALLARDFDLVRIGAGDILRWHVAHRTRIGARVREAMAAGRLVDDSLVEGIVHDRLQQVLERLRRKIPVFVVDASRDPDSVQEQIRTVLGLRPAVSEVRRPGIDNE